MILKTLKSLMTLTTADRCEKTVTVNGIGEVRLVCSRRNRRISLSVRPSGEVRLSYPHGISERRALAFLESRTDWVLQAQKRMSERKANVRTYTPAEIEELRRSAKAALPAKVEYFARRFGFSYGKVTIRAARTKWGCCTGRNNISLSLFLMTLPEHLQDYVIIHELCHTVHHNHSARFHALADKCLGGREKELQRELRNCHTM